MQRIGIFDQDYDEKTDVLDADVHLLGHFFANLFVLDGLGMVRSHILFGPRDNLHMVPVCVSLKFVSLEKFYVVV